MKNLALISLLFLTFFIGCQTKQTPLTETEINNYRELGVEVVGKTFTALSSKLQSEIKTKGKIGAIEFCNINALPLTDSIAKIYQVRVKRAAVNWRNKANGTDELETKIFNEYLENLNSNVDLKPIIKAEGSKVHFFAPILLQPACLACHGNVQTDIGEETYQHIKALYADDKAINFKPGELRGIWSLTFERK